MLQYKASIAKTMLSELMKVTLKEMEHYLTFICHLATYSLELQQAPIQIMSTAVVKHVLKHFKKGIRQADPRSKENEYIKTLIKAHCTLEA